MIQDGNGKDLERFRGYLRLLAELGLNHYRQYRRKIDPSDLVQETLLKAYQAIDSFRGRGDVTIAAWLRQIMARHLSNTVRDLKSSKRDLRREQSFDALLEESSMKLEAFSQSVEPSPSVNFSNHETLLRVARALSDLPDEQREALILKHWQGLSLAEVSTQLNKSPDSVAGLLRRGLKSLRESLREAV